jgi:hypothetical protein
MLIRTTKPIWLSPEVGDRGYVYTMRERAFSQGWPSIQTSCNQAARSSIAFDLHKLSTNQQRSLLGNGIHLCSLANLFVYVMVHIVRRDVVQEFLPDLRLMKVPGPMEVQVVEEGPLQQLGTKRDHDGVIAAGTSTPVSSLSSSKVTSP